MSNNLEIKIFRETFRKEHESRKKWENNMGKVIGMKTFNSKFKEIEEQRKRELEEYEQQVAEMKKKSEEEKQTRLHEIDDNKSTKIMFGSTQSLIGGGYYLPTNKATGQKCFRSTSKLAGESTFSDVFASEKIGFDQQYTKKKDDLKSYFEENVKFKHILKGSKVAEPQKK